MLETLRNSARERIVRFDIYNFIVIYSFVPSLFSAAFEQHRDGSVPVLLEVCSK